MHLGRTFATRLSDLGNKQTALMNRLDTRFCTATCSLSRSGSSSSRSRIAVGWTSGRPTPQKKRTVTATNNGIRTSPL